MGEYPQVGDPTILGAQDRGFLSWNFDPLMMAGPFALTGGVPTYNLFKWPGGVLQGVQHYSSNPLINGVAGQNFMGIYNLTKTLLVATVDQTANWSGAGVGNSLYETLLPANTFLPAGYYYHSILQNHSSGVPHSMMGYNLVTGSVFAGRGQSAGVMRTGIGAGGQTALPGNMGTITANRAYWWGFF